MYTGNTADEIVGVKPLGVSSCAAVLCSSQSWRLAYVYFEEEWGRRSRSQLLMKDEASRQSRLCVAHRNGA